MPYPIDESAPERPPFPAYVPADIPAAYVSAPQRRKFQSRWWLHILLFLLTLAATTFVGFAGYYLPYVTNFFRESVSVGAPAIKYGLWYSLTLLGILGAHEFGHYYFCRKYNVDATLPYFIPAPVLTGTLGAVIKIREPFPTKKVLFDIGVGGPIAGFVVLVPILFWGMSLSTVVQAPPAEGVSYLGEPLLFQWVARFYFGELQPQQALNCHPMVFAAWFGMFATAVNLLPFGQLDGGHISYATLGSRSTPLSFLTVLIAIGLTINSLSWLFMTIMLILMLVGLGARHPRVLYEYEELPRSRYAVAVLALVIFVICFTPVPVDLVG